MIVVCPLIATEHTVQLTIIDVDGISADKY